MARKLIIFISVRIELAESDNLRLKEHPCIPFYLTVPILDRLKVSLLAIFFTLIVESSVACPFIKV